MRRHVFEKSLGVLGLILAWIMVPAMLHAGEGSAKSYLEALRSDNQQARHEALYWLGDQGEMSVVGELVSVLQTSDPISRELAETAIWAVWSRSGDANVDEMLRTGSNLLASGRFVQSIEFFDQIILRQPDFAEGYNKRATAWYYLGEFQRSLDDIRATMDRNPHHFGALSGAGLCMVALKRYQEALFFIDKALKINPNMGSMRTLAEKIRRVAKQKLL